MSKLGAVRRRASSARSDRLGVWRSALLCGGGALALVTGLFALASSEVGATGGTAPTVGWTGATAPLPAQPAPSQNAEPLVFSESCVSAVFCAQAGNYDATSGNGTYVSVLSGGHWTATAVPLPAGTASTFVGSIDDVTCPTAQFCIGVGAFGDPSSNDQAPLVSTYANGQWTSSAVALPADAATSNQTAVLADLSCLSPTSCVAAGSYNSNASGTPQYGLLATLTGSTWSAIQAPEPTDAVANQNASLAAVSCAAPSTCVAVGEYTPSASVNATAAEVLTTTNGTWSAQTPTLPVDAATGANVSAFLNGVSCSAGQCEAGGGYASTNGVSQEGLLAHIVGTTVTTIQAAQPTGHDTNVATEDVTLGQISPNYISCTFTGTCVAAGIYIDDNDVAQGLIETISNGAPSATEAPLPTGASSTSTILNGASCLSGTACTVVGSFETAGGIQPLVDQLSGTTWTPTQPPLPSGDTRAQLYAVSCSSRGACRTAGFVGSSGTSTLYDGSYTPAEGYWLSAADGGIFNYGSAQFHGSAGALRLNAPVVGMAATPGDGGYWEVASDGGIFNYGDAPFYGSAGNLPLVKPVVGMASTPDGGGYWLVASDGGIFAYGDAAFYGSMGGKQLNQPIVGITATPDGHGYWEVASDGGIFSFGDATFYGSMGGKPLNKPVVGIASDASGLGYWEVASDGGIFSFGDATFFGSTGAIKLNKPVVGALGTFDGAGYWLVASDGGIFNYGDAGFSGSSGSLRLNAPVVGGAPS
jgi:hypothetical protein